MSNLAPPLRTKTSIAWLGLILATSLSWGLSQYETGAGHRVAGVTIILVATAKMRIVGLYFMDLRDAPPVLRGLFEGYCASLFLVITTLYLMA